MTIKELIEISHRQACEKGFWGKCFNCDGKDLLKHNCLSCSSSCIGSKSDRNKSELLMLIVTELAEACEALRNNNTQKEISSEWEYSVDENKTCCLAELTTKKHWRAHTFEDELADAVIRIADLCGAMNIDLEWQISKKLEYNKSRAYKHGKQF